MANNSNFSESSTEQSESSNIDETDAVIDDKSDTQTIDYSKSVEDIIADIESVDLSLPLSSAADSIEKPMKAREVTFDESSANAITPAQSIPSKTWFQPTKQHTGLKNVSSNVGAAVSPSNKMEFDQEQAESFGVVKIGRPIGKFPTHGDNTDAMSTISSINSEGKTEQGYFDLKFYHNKLWWRRYGLLTKQYCSNVNMNIAYYIERNRKIEIVHDIGTICCLLLWLFYDTQPSPHTHDGKETKKKHKIEVI